jgi:hypothetical protein
VERNCRDWHSPSGSRDWRTLPGNRNRRCRRPLRRRGKPRPRWRKLPGKQGKRGWRSIHPRSFPRRSPGTRRRRWSGERRARNNSNSWGIDRSQRGRNRRPLSPPVPPRDRRSETRPGRRRSEGRNASLRLLGSRGYHRLFGLPSANSFRRRHPAAGRERAGAWARHPFRRRREVTHREPEPSRLRPPPAGAAGGR